MKVNYYQINKEYIRIEKLAVQVFKKIGKSGNYILGENVKTFEKKISNIINCRYTIGVANGTDALEIALAAEEIKKGTEIITTSNGTSREGWNGLIKSLRDFVFRFRIPEKI